MQHVQYQALSEPVGPVVKASTPTGWLGELLQPLRVASAFAVLATATASAFVAPTIPERTSSDKWWQPASEPVRRPDNRNHSTAGELILTATQRPEKVSLDKWFTTCDVMRIAPSIQRDTYAWTTNPATRERITVEKWFQNTEIPQNYWIVRAGAAHYALYAASRDSVSLFSPDANRVLFVSRELRSISVSKESRLIYVGPEY